MDFNLEGFVDIELIDSLTGKVKYKEKKHNSITPVGLKTFLASCIVPYLQNSAIVAGNREIVPIGFNHTLGAGSLYTYNKDSYGLISPLLLNIDQTNGVKINSESFIDYLDDTLFISSDKLIGYGLNNISPSADNKEGTVEYPNSSTLLDDYTLAVRFKFPEGVATGDFNAVSMVPIVDTSKNLSLYTTKNLIQVATNASPSPSTPSLICPAYCGDCSDDDLVGLNYTSDGLSGYTYNFSTGEIVNKEITQGISCSYCDLVSNWFIDVDGGYAYSCYSNTGYCYINVYNISTATRVKSITINTGYYTYIDLLNISGELYAVLVGNFGNSSSITELSTKVYKLSKGSYDYFSTYDTTELTLASLGVSVPDGAFYLVGSRRSDLSEYEVRGVKFSKYNVSPILGSSYAFTSLSNIHNSIIGVRGNNNVGSGLPISKTNPKSRYFYTSSNYDYRVVGNNTASSASVNSNYGTSQFLNDAGNALSIYLLSSSVSKGENDVLHLTYGFKVSNS